MSRFEVLEARMIERGIQAARNKLMAVWRSESKRSWVCPVCVTGMVATDRVLLVHFEACLTRAANEEIGGTHLDHYPDGCPLMCQDCVSAFAQRELSLPW